MYRPLWEPRLTARPSRRGPLQLSVNRALAATTLSLEPGTQSRTHSRQGVARAYVDSCERLLEQLDRGETGVEKYEIASDEDPSVHTVAKLVRDIAADIADIDADVELVENPRGDDETLVDSFTVDTGRTTAALGWTPEPTSISDSDGADGGVPSERFTA